MLKMGVLAKSVILTILTKMRASTGCPGIFQGTHLKYDTYGTVRYGMVRYGTVRYDV